MPVNVAAVFIIAMPWAAHYDRHLPVNIMIRANGRLNENGSGGVVVPATLPRVRQIDQAFAPAMHTPCTPCTRLFTLFSGGMRMSAFVQLSPLGQPFAAAVEPVGPVSLNVVKGRG